MNVYFEDDNTISINNGTNKECFTRITGDNVNFDCDGTNTCRIHTTNHDFYCVGGIQGKYENCKVNDSHHGEKIGGSQLIYSCTSKNNPLVPNSNHTFRCESNSSTNTETLGNIHENVETNTEKIEYIMNVLNEMPGPRQGALTLRY